MTVRPSARNNALADTKLESILESRSQARANAGIIVGHLDERGAHLVARGESRPGVSIDGDTVFEIGSITKILTTTVLAQMVVAREVALEDPVQRFLPASVRVPGEVSRRITLLDLATHTSALPRIPNNLAPRNSANPYADYTVDRLYDALGRLELTREIGARYEYSNLGMGLLGHALSLAAGTTFEQMVSSYVLQPLGMRDTRIALDSSMQSRFADGHDAAGAVVPPWDIPVLAGAGAFRSTANDMLKFLNGAIDLEQSPLGRAMALAHMRRHPVEGDPNLHVALGWHVLTREGATVVWHNGQTAGFHCFLGVEHATGGNALVLANSVHDIDDIGLHVIDRRFPLRRDPNDRAEIALSRDQLARFAGTYELVLNPAMPPIPVAIDLDGDALWATVPGKDRVQLFAESDHNFFLKVTDGEIAFAVDAQGDVSALTLTQNGMTLTGRRIGA